MYTYICIHLEKYRIIVQRDGELRDARSGNVTGQSVEIGKQSPHTQIVKILKSSFWRRGCYFLTIRNNIPYSLVVTISGSHPEGPGSIPGMGIHFVLFVETKLLKPTLNVCRQRLEAWHLELMDNLGSCKLCCHPILSLHASLLLLVYQQPCSLWVRRQYSRIVQYGYVEITTRRLSFQHPSR